MDGAGAIPASVITTPLGRPEALFRVGAAEKEGQLARAQMRTGPWMRGPDGRPCAGSLGVFLDDLLGNALLAGRPEDYWPVSTELSIELTAPLPVNGSVLTGQGWPVSLEPGVAGSARGRSPTVPARWSPPPPPGSASCPPPAPCSPRRADPPAAPDDAAGPESAVALLGALTRHEDGAVIVTVPGSGDFANPMGNTHGGILLCAAELAGSLALRAGGGPLQTSSIRVVYARSVPVTDTITYTAQVLHRGRTLGAAQVTARGASGKTCALALITAHDQALAS